MATRELDKEGAERQVLRYRFVVRKLSPKTHSMELVSVTKSSVLFRRV